MLAAARQRPNGDGRPTQRKRPCSLGGRTGKGDPRPSSPEEEGGGSAQTRGGNLGALGRILSILILCKLPAQLRPTLKLTLLWASNAKVHDSPKCPSSARALRYVSACARAEKGAQASERQAAMLSATDQIIRSVGIWEAVRLLASFVVGEFLRVIDI